MASKSKEAFISWCLDASSSITVLVLLVAWLSDLQSTQTLFLSKSFVENGFCLSPRFDNTHTACAVFDVICGICCIAAMMTGKAPPSTAGIAAYLFAHGWGHYDIGRSDITEERGLNLQDSILLSIILSFGPLMMASKMVETKKMTRPVANIMAAILLALMVALFFLYIKRSSYGLLYINISIILSMDLPSALLVGFKSNKDVAYRSSNLYWPKELSRLVLTVVIFCEPFYCDTFMAHIGGHFVFDVSLGIVSIVSLVNEQAEQKSKAEKLKLK